MTVSLPPALRGAYVRALLSALLAALLAAALLAAAILIVGSGLASTGAGHDAMPGLRVQSGILAPQPGGEPSFHAHAAALDADETGGTDMPVLTKSALTAPPSRPALRALPSADARPTAVEAGLPERPPRG